MAVTVTRVIPIIFMKPQRVTVTFKEIPPIWENGRVRAKVTVTA